MSLVFAAFISVSTAFGGYNCYKRCPSCVCASNGATGTINVPSGLPCAGQIVTVTVFGTFYGPTVQLNSPGYDTPYSDTTSPCCFLATYACNGQNALVSLCLPSTNSRGNGC